MQDDHKKPEDLEDLAKDLNDFLNAQQADKEDQRQTVALLRKKGLSDEEILTFLQQETS